MPDITGSPLETQDLEFVRGLLKLRTLGTTFIICFNWEIIVTSQYQFAKVSEHLYKKSRQNQD